MGSGVAELNQPETDPDSSATTIARYLVGAVMLSLGLLLAIHETVWRQMEADLAARFTSLITGNLAYSRPGFLIYLTNGKGFLTAAFLVTSECTIGYLVAGVLLISGLLVAAKGLQLRRIISAAALASIILLAFNVIRLGLIGLFVDHLGEPVGYPLAHTYLGTLITIISTVVAGVAYAFVVLRVHKRNTGQHEARENTQWST